MFEAKVVYFVFLNMTPSHKSTRNTTDRNPFRATKHGGSLYVVGVVDPW